MQGNAAARQIWGNTGQQGLHRPRTARNPGQLRAPKTPHQRRPPRAAAAEPASKPAPTRPRHRAPKPPPRATHSQLRARARSPTTPPLKPVATGSRHQLTDRRVGPQETPRPCPRAAC